MLAHQVYIDFELKVNNVSTYNIEPFAVHCTNHLININDALFYKNNLPKTSRSNSLNSVNSQISLNIKQN